MTIRGPIYTNPRPWDWRIGHTSGEHAAFIVRPGKPPAPTNYYWPLTPDIREVRSWTFSEIPSRIPPPNKPYNQTDWPLPVQPYRPDFTWTRQGNTEPPIFLLGPFNLIRTELPSPSPIGPPAITWTQSPFIGNIPPPNKPFNQTDWPLPPPLPPRSNDYTWVNQITPASIPPPVIGFNQYSWPLTPDIREVRTWIETPFTGNIPPPNKPFNTTDWPLPVQPLQRDYTWIETGNAYYGPVFNGPFNQYNWPITLPVTPIDPTWIVEGIGGGALLPYNTYDWPLPGKSYIPDSTWTSFNAVLYTTPIQKPFFQLDWPVPRDIRDSRSYTWSQYPGIIPPPNQPFNQYSWPVPIGYPRPEETWIFPLTLINPPTPIPAGSNYDWPNPRDGRDIRSYTWSQYPGIIPPPNKPFNQYDWPNPGSYPRLDETWVFVLPVIIEEKLPFNQYNWPVPIGYYRPDGTWISTLQIQPAALQPKNQYDWPNPGTYPRPDATWFNTGMGLLTNVQLPIPPGSNYDWPVPKGFPRPDGTFIYTPPPGVIPQPPIVIITGGQKWKDAVLDWKKDSDMKIAAAALARMGGEARAKSLTSKQRSNIASTAARARWK